MADGVLQLPGVPHTTTHAKRSHIPIRSITYKKTVKSAKELEDKKEYYQSITRLNSPTSSAGIRFESTKHDTNISIVELTKSDPPLASADIRFAQTTKAATSGTFFNRTDGGPNGRGGGFFKPSMSITYHKLSLGRSNELGRQEGYMPNIHSKPKPKPPTGNRARGKRPDSLPGPDDYFHLLYDAKRKPFVCEDYDGTYEHFSDEQIKSRIYNMGFRDPEYYGTRFESPPVNVLEEKNIREEFQFRSPVVISALENENTLAAHLLGGASNDIKHIESEIGVAKNRIEQFKDMSADLRQEMGIMKKDFTSSLDKMLEDFRKSFAGIENQIKDDFIGKQNENFRSQKDITLLQRDKTNLERNIDGTVLKLHGVEDVIFGGRPFDLQANHKDFDTLSTMNLRPATSGNMKNRKVIH
jgi:hypothetical protein